jgi:hypothetical protein
MSTNAHMGRVSTQPFRFSGSGLSQKKTGRSLTQKPKQKQPKTSGASHVGVMRLPMSTELRCSGGCCPEFTDTKHLLLGEGGHKTSVGDGFSWADPSNQKYGPNFDAAVQPNMWGFPLQVNAMCIFCSPGPTSRNFGGRWLNSCWILGLGPIRVRSGSEFGCVWPAKPTSRQLPSKRPPL